MSIFDAIKKSVLEGFDTSISGVDIIFGLGVAFLASLFILLIYQRTAKQVSLNRSFCISLLLICSISAMMVMTITSNLALSLGMVGALSIVRFRTAVKDASDTAFLFWSVAAGITAGAGFYLLTLLGCLVVGLICLVAVLMFDRSSKPFLLVVRGKDIDAFVRVEELLEKSGLKYSLSSQMQSEEYTEVIYELGIPSKSMALGATIKALPGITNVSLVDCRKG